VSNLWLKTESGLSNFEWQGGYADFSVSESNLEQVKQYIASQEEHHKKINFQDELRELLRRHRIEWDERYLWDSRNRVAVAHHFTLYLPNVAADAATLGCRVEPLRGSKRIATTRWLRQSRMSTRSLKQ